MILLNTIALLSVRVSECLNDEFLCDQGRCLSHSRVGDLIEDCHDRTDEQGRRISTELNSLFWDNDPESYICMTDDIY